MTSQGLIDDDMQERIKDAENDFGNAECPRCGTIFRKTYFVVCDKCMYELEAISRGLNNDKI